MNDAIDIVITYVTDADPKWCKDYIYYKELEIKSGIQPKSNKQAFGKERTRDWEFLPYWFRAVEKNCSWVRYIWFVCQSKSQVPTWLNSDNPKLRIIYHDQFIPKEFLPTFNPMVIKSFLFKIKGLANNFIESSDDMFFIGQIPENMFFINNKPVDDPVINSYLHKNDDNTIFDKIIENKDKFLHNIYNCDYKYYFHHLPLARNKQFETQFYIKYEQQIKETLLVSKFRHAKNLIWHMYTDAMKFEHLTIEKPIYKNSKCYQIYGDYFNANKLNNKDVVVINDTEFVSNFNKVKYEVLTWFYEKFPQQCSFESTDTCKQALQTIKQLVVAETDKINEQKKKTKQSNTYLYF